MWLGDAFVYKLFDLDCAYWIENFLSALESEVVAKNVTYDRFLSTRTIFSG